LVCYSRLETVILAVGLAMRDIWVNHFPEMFTEIPAHVSNSCFEFQEYEQLSHHAEDLLNGYQETSVIFLRLALLIMANNLLDLLRSTRAFRKAERSEWRLPRLVQAMSRHRKDGVYFEIFEDYSG
jgi:hypothetical protein